MNEEQLIAAAREAALKAYAPYSRFSVGCAIESVDGAGRDRRQYGERLLPAGPVRRAKRADRRPACIRAGQCRADRGRWRRRIGEALAGDMVCTPCGGCRQAIFEAAQLSGRDVEIICANGAGDQVERHRICKLIPHGFGPANLKDAG